MIEDNVVLGKNVRVFNPDLVNIYGCKIGDFSFIGPFVEITSGVEIGKACKIESHSFICDRVKLGNNVFVGHGVMFTNDLFPKVNRQVIRFETEVKDYASIGSNATILAGVVIGRASVVGAGAVVTKSVPDYSIVAGNPAVILRQFSSELELLEYMESRQKLNHD